MTNTTPAIELCPICGGSASLAFKHAVLNSVEATYFTCSGCDFTYARPADWLSKAYSSALASTDTGAVARNEAVAALLTAFAWLSNRRGLRGLDVGGGHGLLVRMLRDRGLDFSWSDQHATNLLARGFEDDGGTYDWLTLVEVFEHLLYPYEFLKALVSRHQPSCIFLTTVLKPCTQPESSWWYWSFETGQHIGFASSASLGVLANRLNYELVSCGGYHLLTRQPRDKYWFRLASSRIKPALALLAKRRMASLTTRDHRQMVLASTLSERGDLE